MNLQITNEITKRVTHFKSYQRPNVVIKFDNDSKESMTMALSIILDLRIRPVVNKLSSTIENG